MARIRHSMNKMPRYGLDSRESWLTAALCGLLLLLCFSTIGVSGVFFYGIVETFGTTRQEASWPVTLNCGLVLLAGTTLSGFYVSANVLVAQHFEKRRVTASSLAYTTGGFYSVVFPALAELFRNTYGTRGAFLLYGAVLMNAVPLSIMLRSSPSKSVQPGKDEVEILHPRQCRGPFCAVRECTTVTSSLGLNHSVEQIRFDGESSEAESDDVVCVTRPRAGSFEARPTGDKAPGVFEDARRAIRPFLTSAFWITTLSFSVISAAVFLFVMISVDLATDRGVSTVDATHILQVFSVTDIAMRPLTGLAVDFKFISLEAVMILGFLLQSAAFELLAWYGSFHMMVLASALMGVTCGSRIPLQAPFLAKDFGVEKIPVLMGVSSFCMGVVSLLRPPFVGYFRDTTGSYTGLLHAVAIVNAILVAVWAVRLLQTRRKRRCL
ncbi:monocarboxylate transporter 5 [Rhipicephalus sanguineus]|uniref:monocarboxylate transporter 5 n=1 Tax=Rhipicephalus sanguineus TaxID=34632 RepID=UPI001894DBDB|nr:monocarboxylate transporter 5 [Rhipicephalus sanguineus]